MAFVERSDDERRSRSRQRRDFPALTPTISGTSPSMMRTNTNDPTSSTDSVLQTPSQTPLGEDHDPIERRRSIFNLTSSTLFGIYQPDRDDSSFLGTGGSVTPISRNSPRGSIDFSRFPSIPDAMPQRTPDGRLHVIHETPKKIDQQLHKHHTPRRGVNYYLPLVMRIAALFVFGVLYGTLISHLRDSQQITPVKVDLKIDTWSYLTFWGIAGVLLGQALPWADTLWSPRTEDTPSSKTPSTTTPTPSSTSPKPSPSQPLPARNTGTWNNAVRSIGAFVGVAFAIRRLPWQSTLQLSLTLALANPAVWYAIDRSPAGFLLSTIFSLSGTAILLSVDPNLIPSPPPLHHHLGEGARAAAATNGTLANDIFHSETFSPSSQLVLGLFSQESVVVTTWILSVLFVSALCFGNVGRRLATAS